MSNKSFNYELLTDSKARAEAKKQAKQINDLLRSSAAAVVDIGKRLNAIRESMTSAMFRAWIECEFQWQQSTAANYMQSARTFGELDCLTQFQPTAIITLARSNVPQKFVDEMIKKARAGETITASLVLKGLANCPEFAPTRKDAGKARKPESDRSIGNGAMQPVQGSIESLQRSLDAFSANLPLLDLEQTEREALADRFFELGMQLRKSRSTTPRPQPKAASTSRASKRSRQLATTHS